MEAVLEGLESEEWAERKRGAELLELSLGTRAVGGREAAQALRGRGATSLAAAVSDGRLEVSKAACAACAALAKYSGSCPAFKDLASAPVLPALLRATAASNRLLSSFAGGAVCEVAKHAPNDGVAWLVADALENHKAPHLKARVAEALLLVLAEWPRDAVAAHAAHIERALLAGVSDPNPEPRRTCIAAFHAFEALEPVRADRLLIDMDPTTRKRVLAASHAPKPPTPELRPAPPRYSRPAPPKRLEPLHGEGRRTPRRHQARSAPPSVPAPVPAKPVVVRAPLTDLAELDASEEALMASLRRLDARMAEIRRRHEAVPPVGRQSFGWAVVPPIRSPASLLSATTRELLFSGAG